mgnify:CR=1 FL=1
MAGTLSVIASVASTLGSLSKARAAQDAANFNAQVASNNAAAARASAAEEGRRQKRQGLKFQGANRAIDPDKGDLLEDSAIELELAFQTALHAGEVQGLGFENTARLETAKSKSAGAQGLLSAASSVLMGGFGAAGGFGGKPLFSGFGGGPPGGTPLLPKFRTPAFA